MLHKNRKKELEKDINPYPKYSYNCGVIGNNGEPILGLDTKWFFWELHHGHDPMVSDKLDKRGLIL